MTAVLIYRYRIECDAARCHSTVFGDLGETRSAVRKRARALGWENIKSPDSTTNSADLCPPHRHNPPAEAYPNRPGGGKT